MLCCAVLFGVFVYRQSDKRKPTTDVIRRHAICWSSLPVEFFLCKMGLSIRGLFFLFFVLTMLTSLSVSC